MVNAERRLAHSACIPCSGFGGVDVRAGRAVAGGVKLGRVTGGGGIETPDDKGGPKKVGGMVNGAGVEGFDGGGVISPSFVGAPNKVEPGEPRVKGGRVGGRVKGVSTEAGVLGAATGNGLATPDLEAKLDKSGGVPGCDNVDASSFLVRLTSVSVDVLGAVGVAIAGGADLHGGGGVVESHGSSGVPASSELRTGRLVLTRGVKLNGELAGGDGFEMGAGGGRSPSLTDGPSSLVGDVRKTLAEGDGTQGGGNGDGDGNKDTEILGSSASAL